MIRSSLKCAGSKCLRPKRLYAAVLLALSGPVYALPEGGEVVAGDATIDVSGDTMQVLQASQRAILNFQSFDIDSGQTVNFQQPGADAVALNRVLGDRLSQIHGALNANGQVYLINPNGVVFGNGAEINVGGLLVTTLDMADQDFLAGRDAFSGDAAGRVENNGSIRAQDRVVLLAPEVVNRGDIQVPDGEIVLRSSRQALLHTAGSEIPILVDDPQLVGQVVNEGSLQAGEVALVLDGSAQHDVYDAAINNSGLVRAVRGTGEGGEIHLISAAGMVNSGDLDASAEQGDGGTITVEADTINQSGVISATAAGEGDGGQVDLLASDSIAMHSGSHIDASADQAGDAGDVVVIAEKSTWFTGDATIKARGGQESGDGGFVEVSGREFINVEGEVDVGADNGEGGLWFIDPTDIRIVPNSPGADNGGGFAGSNPATWAPTGSPSMASINIVTLRNTLANNGDVRISTTSGGTSQGNITVEASLDYDGMGGLRTLTLEADGSIIFNPGVYFTDLDRGTAEGLNFFAIAGTGFTLPNTSSIFAGTGRINITSATGDVSFTGLGSAANVTDAIRVTANGGRLLNAGPATWNLNVNGANAGVILSGRDGIEDITIGNNNTSANGTYVDASSSAGDISVRGEAVLRIDQLSSAGLAAVHAAGELWVTDASVLGGDNFQFSSSSFVALPQSGITVPGMLTLLGPDVVTENYERTLTIGADHLDITVNAPGGNLQLNTAVDTLSITNGFSNTIIANDADALTLGTIAPMAGAIQVTSGAGTDLTVGSDIDLNAMTGSLTLGAGRNLLVNASISDGSAINLTAPNSVIFSSAGEVNAGTGNVSITATGGNVALGSISGNSLTVTAGGAITDANGAAANVSGTSASLTAGTAIGTLANALDTSVDTLNLSAANGGAFIASDQALTLGTTNVTGDLNVGVSAGDLTLTQSNIGGSATFSVSAGDLRIPNAGLTAAGDLVISADAVVDADTTVSLTATNADITLRSGNGIITSNFGSLVLQILGGQTVQVQETNSLNLSRISSNGDVTVTTGTGGNLLIDDIHLGGDDTTFVFNAGGSLTHTGTLASDAGADNIALNFNSTAALNLNGSLRDTNNTATSTHNFNFAAGTNFVMAVNALVGAGDGEIDINAASGNATITGLASLSTAQDAVRVTATGGSIQSANPAAKDIDVPNGGFALSAMGDIGELLVESNFLDVVSTAGNITLSEEVSTSVLRFQTPGTATITTGGQFSVDQATSLQADHLIVNAGTDFRVADTGLALLGDLTVDANTIRGGAGTVGSGTAGSPLILSAANADITLRDGAVSRVWETTFDQLALDIVGGGDFSLEDADGLTLNTVAAGGDASFTTTGADLVLSSAPIVGGELALATVGSGDVVIADTGLVHGGDLTVVADNLVDSNSAIILGATNADITLRGGDTAQSWTTSFDSLVLDIAGTGEFLLTDTDGITLDTIATGGNASFRATAADLTVTADPTVSGDLELATVGSGDVVIADTGLSHTGDLTVLADNLVDSDSGVILSATNANITLRGGDSAQSWVTSFDSLVLDIAGTGDFLLTDSDGLTLTAATTVGNATFRTTNADLLLGATPTVTGELGLATLGSGDVVIPEAGLAHSGDLTILADNLIDSDENVTLAAANADITLRAGSVAYAWNTSFDSLALDLAGTGDFLLTDTDGLTLTSVTTGGNATFRTTAADLVLADSPVVAGELTLTTQTTGDLVLADTGLVHNGDLTITADYVRDSDSTVTLGGANATITLRGGDAAQTWNTSFDALVLDIAGSGDFSLTDSDALILTSVSTGGSASFAATGGDLTLTAAPSVAGDLSLSTLGSGDMVIPALGLNHGGDLIISADNLRDTDSTVTLADAAANITLRDGAAAQTWNTSFDELVLDLAGTGALTLIDTDGLTLTSANTGGAASFTATDADLVVASSPTVAGALSLTTDGSGDLVIPQTGLLHSGNLTVVADAITDGDSAITLAATNADIRLRGGETAQSWATSFNTLVLDIAGGGDFALTDTDGLTLTSVATGGNASFTTTGADLVLAESPSVVGDLTLATQGGGDVIVPNTGLAHNGTLVLTADSVRDSDSAVTITATDLIATLVDQQLAASWNTTVERLELSIAGGGALTLNNSDSLLLDSLISDGLVDLTTVGDLQVGSVTGAADMALTSGGTLNLLNSNYDVDGELSLTAADIQVAADGLTVTDAMRLQAETLSAAGGGPLILAGSSADLTLTGNQALALTSRLSQLGLTYNATNSLSLTNDRSLLLERFEIPNVTTLGLTVNGTLTMPDTGLAASERINIDAVDLLHSDRDLTFVAPELAVRLSGASGDYNWDVTTETLDVLMRGQANLQVNTAEGLVLRDLNGDAQALSLENGNVTVNLASGDLVVAGNVSAADLTDDEVRAGVIDLNIGEGSLLTSGPVAITSTNLVDQDVGEGGAAYAIRVRLTDTAEANHTITLGDGTNAAALRAIGGDILLDTRALGTAAAATRNLVRNAGSTIDVFNNPGDALNGQVLRNGSVIAAESWQSVRAGRTLAIVTDVAETPPGNVLDDIDDLDGSTDIVKDVVKSGPKAAVQFEQVFGTCDELDKKNRHRCRVDDALKSFLSHWLVGGEMPPKTEIR